MLHLKHQLCSFYGSAVIIIANHLIRMVLIDLIILYLGQAGTHYLNRNDRCKRQKKIRPTFPTFDATSIGVIMKKLKKKHAERLLFKSYWFLVVVELHWWVDFFHWILYPTSFTRPKRSLSKTLPVTKKLN